MVAAAVDVVVVGFSISNLISRKGFCRRRSLLLGFYNFSVCLGFSHQQLEASRGSWSIKTIKNRLSLPTEMKEFVCVCVCVLCHFVSLAIRIGFAININMTSQQRAGLLLALYFSS